MRYGGKLTENLLINLTRNDSNDKPKTKQRNGAYFGQMNEHYNSTKSFKGLVVVSLGVADFIGRINSRKRGRGGMGM